MDLRTEEAITNIANDLVTATVASPISGGHASRVTLDEWCAINFNLDTYGTPIA